jgi:4-hydroxybenzoate polyprenyltransferase
MRLRVVLAGIVGALVCVVGALILGEYEFTGVTPYGVGLLFGLVVSEFVLEVGRRRHPVIGVLTALAVAGALAWAGWISSGEGLRPFPAAVWVAMAIGAVCAGARTGGWRGDRDVKAPG